MSEGLGELVKSQLEGSGFQVYFAAPTLRLPAPTAHYRIYKDGSVEQLVSPESVEWGSIDHG